MTTRTPEPRELTPAAEKMLNDLSEGLLGADEYSELSARLWMVEREAEHRALASTSETPGSEAGLAELPRLRLTGEQLDGLDATDFHTDWDEYDEFVRLDDVRAALATALSPEERRG